VEVSINSAESLQIKQWLLKYPLFLAFTAEELDELATLCSYQSFLGGQTIVNEGFIVDCVYLITEGQAEVRINQQPVSLLGKGESIGLSQVGFFSKSGLRTATVIALTELNALRLEVVDFQNFLVKHPHASQAIVDSVNLFTRINFLKQAVPFSNLSTDRLAQLATEIEEIVLPNEEIIFREGDAGNCCYLIETGSVEISIQPAGQTKILAQLEPPTVFGEASLLSQLPRNATAKATQETRLLILERHLFDELIEAEPSVAKAMTHIENARNRPKQIGNIEIYQQQSSDKETLYTLKNPNQNQYYRLSDHGFFIWQHLDGTCDLSEITFAFYHKYGIFNPQIVSTLIYDLYRCGFVSVSKFSREESDENIPFYIKALISLRNAMEKRWGFENVDNFLTKTYHHFFWIFYTKFSQIFLALIALVGLIIFAGKFSMAADFLAKSNQKWQLVLISYIFITISVLMHELAHAYTTKAYGRQVNAFGIGWLWITPFAFCDTSDMWLASHKQRFYVDIAGLYLHIVLGGIAGLLMLFVGQPNLMVICWLVAIGNYSMAIANLSPLMEFDGYYALMDLLNTSNLRAYSVNWLAHSFKREDRGSSFFIYAKDHPKAVIYWITTLVYLIVMEGIVPYIILRYLLHGLFTITNPLISVGLILFAFILSIAGIWAEIQQKK
jgi:CRP-like cAMP-binding protein/Zn-dependent protease